MKHLLLNMEFENHKKLTFDVRKLSSGFATWLDSNQSTRLQRIAKLLKLHEACLAIISSRERLTKVLIRLRRMVWAFVVGSMQQSQVFSCDVVATYLIL